MFDGSLTEYTILKDHDHRMARLNAPQVTHRQTLAALTARTRRAAGVHTAASRRRTRVMVSWVMSVAVVVLAGLWAALSTTPPPDLLGAVPGIHDAAAQ